MKLIQIAALGVGLSCALIAFVFATGSTFGQRCTALGFKDQAWETCVHNLASGKTP